MRRAFGNQMSGISEVIGPEPKIVPKKHGEHEQAFASPLPLWERVPRQGQERGYKGLMTDDRGR
ncbi:hypothetical protein FACS1894158_00580 [Betaproteobacteria bacterium]|nr:hypothetical protein FACS1894158_00580 [Betaproteobacteria bacterium]